MRSKMLKTFSAFCVLMVLSGCGDDSDKGKDGAATEQSDKKGDAAQAPAKPMEVGVVTIRRQNVDLDVALPGRVSAFQAAEIRPQVSGIILKRMFEEGALVQQGQQLYQIDPATYQAAYNTAAAQLKRAEANLKSVKSLAGRYKDLVKIDAVSKQEYDNAVAGFEQAEADVAIARAAKETAQINLDYTKVFSPISGRIGKSSVTPGALVTANQADPLALVQQLDPIYVDVTQSSSDMMKLREKIEAGQVVGTKEEAPVSLLLDDLGQSYHLTGMMKFSDVTVDQTTGNVQIRALFPNPEHQLLPGLFVRAVVKQGHLNDTLLVPQQAVTRTPTGQAMAWVVDQDNKVQSKPVETGQAIKDKWVVTKGLEGGERVIVQGSVKVQPGMPVTPVDLDQEKAAAETKQQPAEAKPVIKENETAEPAIDNDGGEKPDAVTEQPADASPTEADTEETKGAE